MQLVGIEPTVRWLETKCLGDYAMEHKMNAGKGPK